MPLSTFKEVLHVIRGVLAWKIRPMPIKTYLLILNRTGPMASPNHSPEATWDAPRFAYEGTDLISWKASDGANPGASARGR